MKLCGLVNGVVGWHSTWWLISMTKCGMHRYGTVYAFVVVFVQHILSCWTIARLISVMQMHALIHSANGEVESHQENKSSCYGLSRARNATDVVPYWYSKSGQRFGVQSSHPEAFEFRDLLCNCGCNCDKFDLWCLEWMLSVAFYLDFMMAT